MRKHNHFILMQIALIQQLDEHKEECVNGDSHEANIKIEAEHVFDEIIHFKTRYQMH